MTSVPEMTEDMQFCLSLLNRMVREYPDNVDLNRALRGAQYMSLALDGLSGMLRALPEETQQRMAQDMYEMAVESIGGNVH
jgi:hypothetical protein